MPELGVPPPGTSQLGPLMVYKYHGIGASGGLTASSRCPTLSKMRGVEPLEERVFPLLRAGFSVRDLLRRVPPLSFCSLKGVGWESRECSDLVGGTSVRREAGDE